MAEKRCDLQFAVLGLGRFGMSIVKTLAEYDANILACDKNMARLHEATDYATHVVQLDVTDEDAMDKLGLGNFDVVVLAMGEDFESTVLSSMKVKELGTAKILAKAVGERQKKILESIGVDQVVLPEIEMGAKIARQLAQNNILDILENAGHAITEMHPMEEWTHKTVSEANIRQSYGYSILAVIRGKQTIIPVSADLVLLPDDLLITLS